MAGQKFVGDTVSGLRTSHGVTTTLSYDSLLRRISVAEPDLGSWSYIYDAGSHLTSQTDARGVVTTLGYDAMSRITAKTVTGSGFAVSVRPPTPCPPFSDSDDAVF